MIKGELSLTLDERFKGVKINLEMLENLNCPEESLESYNAILKNFKKSFNITKDEELVGVFIYLDEENENINLGVNLNFMGMKTVHVGYFPKKYLINKKEGDKLNITLADGNKLELTINQKMNQSFMYREKNFEEYFEEYY